MQLPEQIYAALGWLAFQFVQLKPQIPTYLHLLISAIFPIYAGAHASLSRPSSAAKSEKQCAKDQADSTEEDDEEHRMESLSPSDAILFPILAGCTLAGLYFLIKWLGDAELLNKILNWYFATFSVFAISKLVSDGLNVGHSLVFPRLFVDDGILFNIHSAERRALPDPTQTTHRRNSPLPGRLSRIALPKFLSRSLWFLQELPSKKIILNAFVRRILQLKIRLGTHDIVGLLAGIFAVLYYNLVDKPWPLTNLMGFGFAYGALQLMSPAKFLTGTTILLGLFCYDIYFVFFTPMMVTVAKSLDIPIKLLFPRPSDPGEDPAHRSLSMLGLGDIVLPGMIIGLALRFDLFLFYLKKQSIEKATPAEDASTLSDKNSSGNVAESRVVKAPYKSVANSWGERIWTYQLRSGSGVTSVRGRFPKPYFHASLFGYILGMVMTLLAMQMSHHAQPALLYLVPCVLVSLWTTALFRGELEQMTNFDDNPEATSGDNDKKEASTAIKTEAKHEKAANAIEDETGGSTAVAKENQESSGSSLANRERGQHGRRRAEESDQTLISFSIKLQASGTKVSTRGEAESKDDNESIADDSDKPQWRSGKGQAKDEGHSEKRLRVG